MAYTPRSLDLLTHPSPIGLHAYSLQDTIPMKPLASRGLQAAKSGGYVPCGRVAPLFHSPESSKRRNSSMSTGSSSAASNWHPKAPSLRKQIATSRHVEHGLFPLHHACAKPFKPSKAMPRASSADSSACPLPRLVAHPVKDHGQKLC